MQYTLMIKASKTDRARYCDGYRNHNHIRVKMLWHPPYWYCDVCGHRIYDGKLKRWHMLDKRKRYLEMKIANKQSHLQHLRRSYNTYRSPIITDMPGTPLESRVADSVGEFVAQTLDRIEQTQMEIEQLQQDLRWVEIELADIEGPVSEMREDYRRVVEMYYRDRCSWESIAAVTHFSKSRIYEILEEAEAVVDLSLWRR